MSRSAANANAEAGKLAYTVNEAAAALGLSRSTIYKLVREHELTTFTWCGRTLIRADVLRAAMERASGDRAA